MKKIILIFLIMSFYGVAFSQEESNCEVEDENGEIITCRYSEDEEEEEEFCGLETKFKDGSLYSLKSCACGEWVGKYKKRKRRVARRKAELRANRAISEFMQVKLKSSDFLKGLSEDLEKECYEQDGDTPDYCPQDEDSVSEDGSVPPPEEGGAVSEFAEALSESIEQSSEQIMSGIRKIGNGPTDKEDKSACVWMGWSLKTNKAAGQLRKEMDKNIKKDKKVKIKEKSRRKSNDTAGSKSKDFDDF